jgi:hypothetical protein
MVFLEQDLVKSKCLPQERKDTPTYWRHVYIEKRIYICLKLTTKLARWKPIGTPLTGAKFTKGFLGFNHQYISELRKDRKYMSYRESAPLGS